MFAAKYYGPALAVVALLAIGRLWLIPVFIGTSPPSRPSSRFLPVHNPVRYEVYPGMTVCTMKDKVGCATIGVVIKGKGRTVYFTTSAHLLLKGWYENGTESMSVERARGLRLRGVFENNQQIEIGRVIVWDPDLDLLIGTLHAKFSIALPSGMTRQFYTDSKSQRCASACELRPRDMVTVVAPGGTYRALITTIHDSYKCQIKPFEFTVAPHSTLLTADDAATYDYAVRYHSGAQRSGESGNAIVRRQCVCGIGWRRETKYVDGRAVRGLRSVTNTITSVLQRLRVTVPIRMEVVMRRRWTHPQHPRHPRHYRYRYLNRTTKRLCGTERRKRLKSITRSSFQTMNVPHTSYPVKSHRTETSEL